MRSDRRSYPSPSPSRVRVLRARAITAIPYHGLPSAHTGLYAVYGYTVYGIRYMYILHTGSSFPAILRLPVVTTHACASDLRDECKLEPSIGGAWAEKGDRDNDGKRLAIVRGCAVLCVRASRSYLHSGEGEGEGEGEREGEN